MIAPNNPNPHEWHTRPKGTSATDCSICGLLRKRVGEHRRIKGDKPHWQLRHHQRSGRAIIVDVCPRYAERHAVDPGTIGKAATMFALGRTHPEIDAALKLRKWSSTDFAHKFADLWNVAVEKAMVKVLAVVRAQAGTDAVLDDTPAYIARAARCDQWCRIKGEPLFAGDGRMRMRAFYEAHYKPVRLSDATVHTIGWHRAVLKKWELLTADPAIEDITAITLARFRDAMAAMLGRDRVHLASPNTVWQGLSFIQGVLDRAGPPQRRMRDAVGLLDKVPWVKPPKKMYTAPIMATTEQLNDIYRTCVAMDRPHVTGVKPPAWWRAIVVVCFNTGLRRGTLESLRMKHIDWKGKRLIIPPKVTKTGQGQIIHLTEVALSHLQAIKTDRELVFEGFNWRHSFYAQFRKLQALAGIPDSEHIGLHAIRKATATLLWEFDPQAAMVTMGHTTPAVTRQRYVDNGGIITRALDRLPQPSAFTEGGAQ